MAKKLIINNFTAYLGKDFQCQWTYKNGSTVIDLTGFTWDGEFKDSAGTTQQSIALQGDNITTGLYINDVTTGVVNLNVRIAELASLGAGTYTYEIRVTDGDPKEEIFATGEFIVKTNGNHT